MPVSSRDKKAEAKYNVSTDFPQLGLHAAAATGNIGLVKYALSHGQPINSVIDGILPLHAACSGGNDHVVKFLIDAGADVNAPRLPRRYSSTTAASSSSSSSPSTFPTSALSVGASGATPLHFAAANGHTQTVHLLLRHGARPDRADKHGVTPETLARQAGWPACADALRDWPATRDADLRDRDAEFFASSSSDHQQHPPPSSSPTSDAAPFARARHGSLSTDDAAAGRKRLAVKRSLDIAVRRLRSSSSLALAHPLSSSPRDDAPSPQTPPDSPAAHRQRGHHHHRSRRPSSASGQTPPPRKIASKYSLLNLFRKPSADALGATPSDASSAEDAPGKTGILRGHGRSASSSGPTKLRFGAAGAGDQPRADAAKDEAAEDSQDSDGEELEEEEEEEEEEEYGRPIPRRGLPVASQPDADVDVDGAANEFPFSIEHPPVEDSPVVRTRGLDDSPAVRTRALDDDPAATLRHRPRGDSLSTTASSLFLLRTPSAHDAPLPGVNTPPPLLPVPSSPPPSGYSYSYGRSPSPLPLSKSPRAQSPIPLPLSKSFYTASSPSSPTPTPRSAISIISTHAEAEALVLRTQASVLALDADESGNAGAGGIAGAGVGVGGEGEDDGVPLSVRLAAYGESLAIARRLKDREREEREREREEREVGELQTPFGLRPRAGVPVSRRPSVGGASRRPSDAGVGVGVASRRPSDAGIVGQRPGDAGGVSRRPSGSGSGDKVRRRPGAGSQQEQRRPARGGEQEQRRPARGGEQEQRRPARRPRTADSAGSPTEAFLRPPGSGAGAAHGLHLHLRSRSAAPLVPPLTTSSAVSGTGAVVDSPSSADEGEYRARGGAVDDGTVDEEEAYDDDVDKDDDDDDAGKEDDTVQQEAPVPRTPTVVLTRAPSPATAPYDKTRFTDWDDADEGEEYAASADHLLERDYGTAAAAATTGGYRRGHRRALDSPRHALDSPRHSTDAPRYVPGTLSPPPAAHDLGVGVSVDDLTADLALTRISTAPGAYGGGVGGANAGMGPMRRANKLARMGMSPGVVERERGLGVGVGYGAGGGGEKKWGIGKWVASLKGRG